jgi:hypothetical protein
MTLVPLKVSEAFPLNVDQRASFEGTPTPYRISGPPGLARLVGPEDPRRQRDNRKTGFFWFEEPVFTRLRDKARAELMRLDVSSGEKRAKPSCELTGLYMKFCLRGELAICKNFTPIFDGYAILPLRPVDSLVAWVGKIKDQPYYSKPRPEGLTKAEYQEQMQAYELAEAGGTSLVAQEKQYIVDFNFPANKPFANRILGPWRF